MSDPHPPRKVVVADKPGDPDAAAPGLPRHESLEAVFFAAVPPRRPPVWKRLALWLLPRALALPPVRALILKRFPDA